MKLVGLCGSLTKNSKTLLAVKKAVNDAKQFDSSIESENIHLHNYKLDFCDGRDPSDYEGDTHTVIEKIVEADAYIIGTPVYRESLTGALKNVFDLIPNDSFRGKVIGFIASGGS
ncbi:NADPH-dependent FMN reductase [Evansella halocellulosilytica]|uniref:NADPH-dependent FMN reductase n=1 Tax=Evansella halocellulosilytica TaxID=2011013 RepID=UPI00211CF932|nr:NAD(P)H-dependent oxidoreductase [Evansella halocellulosilytica]